MNAKEAKEIVSRSNNGHGLDGLEMAAFNTAKGFLEAVEKFNPVVEALDTQLQRISNLPFKENFDTAIKIRKVLETYRRDVLGES